MHSYLRRSGSTKLSSINISREPVLVLGVSVWSKLRPMFAPVIRMLTRLENRGLWNWISAAIIIIVLTVNVICGIRRRSAVCSMPFIIATRRHTMILLKRSMIRRRQHVHFADYLSLRPASRFRLKQLNRLRKSSSDFVPVR